MIFVCSPPTCSVLRPSLQHMRTQVGAHLLSSLASLALQQPPQPAGDRDHLSARAPQVLARRVAHLARSHRLCIK